MAKRFSLYLILILFSCSPPAGLSDKNQEGFIAVKDSGTKMGIQCKTFHKKTGWGMMFL
jgi:hypothetical protein